MAIPVHEVCINKAIFDMSTPEGQRRYDIYKKSELYLSALQKFNVKLVELTKLFEVAIRSESFRTLTDRSEKKEVSSNEENKKNIDLLRAEKCAEIVTDLYHGILKEYGVF